MTHDTFLIIGSLGIRVSVILPIPIGVDGTFIINQDQEPICDTIYKFNASFELNFGPLPPKRRSPEFLRS